MSAYAAKKEAMKRREALSIELLKLWQKRPDLFAKHILGVQWTEKQIEIAMAVVHHKKVFVRSGNNLGKSFLLGGLALWRFACFNPGITLVTGPTELSVMDILFKEIRSQALAARSDRLAKYLMPSAPRMESNKRHFVQGLTASSGTAFHGRHEESVFVIFDEAVDIENQFWEATESMMGSQDCAWISACNPTDVSTEAFFQSTESSDWHVIEMSCLDHPNIKAELEGKSPIYPAAINLNWLNSRIREWCDAIPAEDHRAGDFEFPPNSGKWHRPGPIGEARLLGRWPSQGAMSVWTEAMWQYCLIPQEFDRFGALQIGCDRAGQGDDFTSIFVRRGRTALHHEERQGYENDQIAGRLKELCRQFVLPGQDPKRVPCLIDDVTHAVCSHASGFNFQDIDASKKATEENYYPNKRSELWFATADRAKEGTLDFSRLSPASLKTMRIQCMAPKWKVDSQGRRVVEPKEMTKKRLKRSPDTLDSVNLAYYGAVDWKEVTETLSKVQQVSTRRLISAHGGLW